jgi:hypothetical protein
MEGLAVEVATLRLAWLRDLEPRIALECEVGLEQPDSRAGTRLDGRVDHCPHGASS